MANYLVTGASRGIGLEFVRQLVKYSKKPANIFALCRDPSKAKGLQEVANNHDNVRIIKADMVEFDKYKDVAEEIQQYTKDGGLNLLVNNAGIMIRDTLSSVIRQSVIDSLDLNAVAPLLFTKTLLPLLKTADGQQSMVKTGKSVVLNISAQLSSIEENTSSGYISYRMSKTTLNMVTKTLAVELKPFDIFVMALHPGWVKTDMGGATAPLSTEDSVKGMLNTVARVEEQHRGALLNHKGRMIPW